MVSKMSDRTMETLQQKLELFMDNNVGQETLQIVGRLINRLEYGGLTEHDKDLIFLICSHDETEGKNFN